MILFEAIIVLVAAIFAFLWRDACAHLRRVERKLYAKQAALDTMREQLDASDEIRHSVADSALRGCPAVKWRRPYPVPAGADAWYWRAMFAGEPHLFTDEALREARQRASHLLPSGRSIPALAPHSIPCATS